jgi:uncharacterized NAD-dependent epimerase/dehydratase family protein
MNAPLDGNAVVYCESHFGTTNGKTAHGLVRFTRRYRVLSVIDSRMAGQDAGQALDGRPRSIPILADLPTALRDARDRNQPATHWVIGLAPDGGRLSEPARRDVLAAIRAGLNVDSGLHDFLSLDPEISAVAAACGVRLRDVRKPPPREELHFFSGKIREVKAVKVAVLGTDSTVGKRTTAWLLVEALTRAGLRAEMIGTGQTAWLQGARYSLCLDALVNDFVSGEIEHAIWRAWNEQRPDVIVIEGQGSLMNPGFPGGFEILAAGRPEGVIMQHAPARAEYDGFPGYPIDPLKKQIQAVELLSGKPVIAVSINHENLDEEQLDRTIQEIHQQTGLPVCDPLRQGVDSLAAAVAGLVKSQSGLKWSLNEDKLFGGKP